jgi:hypothetical protein
VPTSVCNVQLYTRTCTVRLSRQTDAHFELHTAAAGSAAIRPLGEVLRPGLRRGAAHRGAAARPVAVTLLLADAANLKGSQLM